MTGPTSDFVAATICEGLPADLASSWPAAVAVLTESELTAVVLRFGFKSGKPESFTAIARDLGVNRARAHALFRNAIQRLGSQEETRALARYLADLNAVLSEEEPEKPLSRLVPDIEDFDDVATDVGADADTVEPVRDAPTNDLPTADAESPNDAADLEDSAGDNGSVDQDEPEGQDESAADEPVSEREALALVRAADRELARAIECCTGREELLAALQRARTRIAAGMREIELNAPVSSAKAVRSAAPVPAPGKRRGRPENVQETARRSAVLERVESGEISNAEAAKELGISYGAWAGWKTNHGKRNGLIAPAPSARASVAPSPIPAGKRGRGRRSDPVETARRSAVLQRVQAGEITNAEAAAELGITYGAWSGWKTQYAKRAGIIVATPKVRASVAPSPVLTGKRGRGRRSDPVEAARRSAVLERVQAGEISNAQAAAQLGLTYGTWNAWKAKHGQRNESVPAPAARSPRTPDVTDLAARIERLRRFKAELRRRVRELIVFVEERAPR